MVEGVISQQALGLGCCEQCVVAGGEGEGELLVGQGTAVTQSHGQLHGIVSLELTSFLTQVLPGSRM